MIRTSTDLVSFLEDTRLLEGFTRPELEVFASVCTAIPLDPGDILFQEGDPAVGLHLILEGRLAASRKGQEIGDLLEGDHLGEGALVDAGPRRVTVRAADPTTVATLSREALGRLAEARPDVHAHLMEALLREMARKMHDAEGFLDTPGRVR
jgi:CRP-like cAMP-binding protein